VKVFVYGTLKRDYWNWKRYLRDRADFVAEGTTQEKFTMVELGFPMVFPDPNGHPVRGEIFDVDQWTLQHLDRLEGEGRMYFRRLQLIDAADGQVEMCMMYVGAPYRNDGELPPVAPDADGVLTWSAKSTRTPGGFEDDYAA
jgi:gamma-glutamylcyclotransferase (GGCT)/AIG2-like uncharacterized protein YtfP